MSEKVINDANPLHLPSNTYIWLDSVSRFLEGLNLKKLSMKYCVIFTQGMNC